MLPNRVGCASTFDSFRRYLKHPAKNKRNQQTENDEQNNQSNDPVRNVEDRKNLRDALREGPTRDDVRDRDLVNVAPLQLGEEFVDLHFGGAWNSRAGTIFSASASKRGSPRSGSSNESTLIYPISEPARS